MSRTSLCCMSVMLLAAGGLMCTPAGPIPPLDKPALIEDDTAEDNVVPGDCTTIPQQGDSAASTGPPASLTRSVNGAGVIFVDPDRHAYYCGETVTVQAVPDAGWVFSSWEGDLAGTLAQQQLAMTRSKAVLAVFAPDVPHPIDEPTDEPGPDDGGADVPQPDEPPDEPTDEPQDEPPDVPSWLIPPTIELLEDDAALVAALYSRGATLTEGSLPVTWSLVSGPAGMTISAETGEIRWPDPQAAGSEHTVTITAANRYGSDQTSYQLKVMTVELLDYELSSTSAHDGQTIQAAYRIAGPPGLDVRLVCRLIGPDETLGTDDEQPSIRLESQADWYHREFLVNAAPGAATGAYGVEWEIQWDPGRDAWLSQSSRKRRYLTVTEALPVRVPILMYHYVGPIAHSPYWVSTERFAQQMRALKAYGYTTVSFADLMMYRAGEAIPPAKPVILTFDDGPAGLYSDVWPILADPAIDFTATVFLITDSMGYSSPPHVLLTWEQAMELHQSGRFDMQSHSATHAYLSELTGDALMSELAGSRREIETRLDKPVNFLCWPYGDLNGTAKHAAWTAGYHAAIGIGPGVEPDSSDKWSFRRVFVNWQTTLDYAPRHRDDFFLVQIADPDVVIPHIRVHVISALNPDTQQPWAEGLVPRGGRIQFAATVSNQAPATPVKAILALSHETSGDHDSSSRADLMLESFRELASGSQLFEWDWTVPSDAAPGQYHARVAFGDPHDVVNWHTSAWEPAFAVGEP